MIWLVGEALSAVVRLGCVRRGCIKLGSIGPVRGLLALTASLTLTASAAIGCEVPPPAPKDLELNRYYGDRAGTDVSRRLVAEYRAKTKELRTFVRDVGRRADLAWQAQSTELRARHAVCGLDLLMAWAEAGAYLGRMSSKQAEYQRKWDFTGLALGYLKLRKFATPRQVRAISRWLRDLAHRSDAFQSAPGRKPNNHLYWLGLGLGATALATDDAALWQRTREIMRQAASHIRDDGVLPLELERGKRALHYHVFAVMPLIVLAELGASRGEDWYGFNDGALNRLTALTVAGIYQPILFDRLAGKVQERPINQRAGWAFLYAHRFRGRRDRRIPVELTRKRAHRLLGGDVRVLLAALR